LNEDLQSCKFTWNSSGCKILSVNVTVEVASKSQVASLTIASVATFLRTYLNFTFGFTSIPPFAIVEPDNNAAETYFPANSPA
jgi:hypothetical protein